MTKLELLKKAKTLADLAMILKYKRSALAYIIYTQSDAQKYNQFQIAKKTGGKRDICAPNERLKLLQRKVDELLQSCYKDIITNNKNNQSDDKIAHGFKPNRSIITNATPHKNKRFVFNVDLLDFFGSFNFGRVRGYFITNKDFQLDPSIATVLAQIACHNNSLPQGSPCSPVITNLITHIMDIRLASLAKKTSCRYTRYADDLTFSTNKRIFPSEIATCSDESGHDWQVGYKLAKEIKKCGFEVNPKKTRLQYCDSRQDVTGLVVNKKLNVKSEYKKNTRAMVHRLTTTGDFYIGKNSAGEEIKGNMQQLEGRLGHINHISPYKESLFELATFEKVNNLTFRHFLIYKNFYQNELPTIVCEGKTDNVYLRYAIQNLEKDYPTLIKTEAGKKSTLRIRLFNYNDSSTGKITGLTGGVSFLKKFIDSYQKHIKLFKPIKPKSALILLIDNDTGANAIVDFLKNKLKKPNARSDAFTHVSDNLYVVLTPLSLNGKSLTSTEIEDCFQDSTRNIKIGSKSFSIRDVDNDNYFGKHIFAIKIVREQAHSIDFSGFKPLLERIEMAIKHYESIK